MIQGGDFLPVAAYLRQESGEAYLRTRVGRAYYAAYLEVRTFCELQLGYVRKRTSREHQEVAILLRVLDSDMVDKLKFLRTFRNVADYDIHLSPSTLAITADDAHAMAEQIIARLDELTANQRRS
jgi:hypothetical protein